MRTVPEWRGKTDNHMPPAKVRQRILDREGSACHICRMPITGPGWHADHVPPLKDGGENRESMIKPAHAKCHRLITAKQATERAPVERKKMKDSGAIAPKARIPSQGFRTSAHKAKREASQKAELPKRPLYQEVKA